MRIGILSRNHTLYSTRRLVEAAREHGHEVMVVNTTAVAVEVSSSVPSTPIKVIETGLKQLQPGQHWAQPSQTIATLPQMDAIIPRIGASITFYGLAVVRLFEAQGVVTVATSQAIAQSRDKLHSLQVMQYAGLPIPRTAIIADPSAISSVINTIGPPPVIVKLIQGTQGHGVFLIPNLSTTAAVLKKLRGLRKQALIQEYIPEANGQDIRVIVIGGRCVAAMMRIAPKGDFRANLHRGGTAVAYPLDAQTEKLAIAAAQAHGLGFAGVDIIQSKRGPLLLEVNSSPGLEGIEGVTGVDMAGEVIAYLEQLHKKKRSKNAS